MLQLGFLLSSFPGASRFIHGMPGPLLRLVVVGWSLILKGVLSIAPTTETWCPKWHNIYQANLYDPSAPIRLSDGTWHMWPDGCGGWCHYSSKDLFHWIQHPPMPKLGGLTGSISFTSASDGLVLLHPKGGDWIARATPNGG